MADLSNIEKNRTVIEGSSGTDMIVNSDGSLSVRGVGVISSLNSTSVTLGIGGTFTGTGEDVSSFSTITVAIFSGQASATNGLKLEFSVDNANWDHSDEYTIPANTGKVFSVGVTAQYFRVRYTNGSILQTSFRLQTVFRYFSPKSSSHRVQDSIANDDDVEIVKAVLAGKNDGNFLNVNTTSDGRLMVSQELVVPGTSTQVVQTAFGSVSTTTGTDINYTITNGTILTIQRLSAGAEDESGGSVVELFEDPTGLGTPLTRIEMLFINGTSASVDVGQDFTGDGTRRIIMRRRGYTASAREMFARWQGYET